MDKKIAYIALTKGGSKLAYKLRNLMGTGDIYLNSKLIPEVGTVLSDQKDEKVGTVLSSQQEQTCVFPIEGQLKDFMKQLFEQYDYLICIMATGIVVRVIAPYVASKFRDPAILVLDEKGENVISLLSGHMGGGNEMTRYISQLIQAHPVITTATDVNQKAALDMIIHELNAYTDNLRESVKDVNTALVNGQKVGLYIDGDYKVDQRGFMLLSAEELQVSLMLKENEDINKSANISTSADKLSSLDYLVYIGTKANVEILHPKLIKVVPQQYVLGVGCKKATDSNHMLESFKSFMTKYNIDEHAISKIGSIELKKDEAAIHDLSQYLNVPFKVFAREEIAKVEDLFEGSAFVKQNIGVSCVAEPSAYLLGSGEVIITKEKYQGITFSLGSINDQECF